MCPAQTGRIAITEPVLTNFMASDTRTLGELLALIKRDILKVICDAYSICRNCALNDGFENIEYTKSFREHVTNVSNVIMSVQGADVRLDRFISIQQLQNGIKKLIGYLIY
jgi:hypothetical protein